MGYLKINNLYKDKKILQFKQVYAMEKIHGCLDKNSLVKLSSGEELPIYLVKSGDEVVSYDTDAQSFTTSKVLELVVQEEHPNLEWYEIEMSNGRKIICTEDHPFLTTDGWVTALNLTGKENIIGFE